MKPTSIKGLRFIAALGALVAISCESGNSGLGGETHWLDACRVDEDCTRGRCICGLCTEPCSGDDACRGETRRGACFIVASPGLAGHCAAGATGEHSGVCLALCEDGAPCPAGATCRAGACVADKKASIEEASVPRASDFKDVDATTDFSSPVVLPEPSAMIAGATDVLVGTWEEVGADGGRCEPQTTRSGYDDAVCPRLEIVKRGATYAGTLWFRNSGNPSHIPAGPFPAPVDADVGYPVGTTVEDRSELAANVRPDVPYRLLDAAVVGNSFSFRFALQDLWSDWCQLQHAYQVEVHGSAAYRCVPDSADETNTDRGKLDLCRSALDGPQCSTNEGAPIPCACTDAAGSFVLNSTCHELICACTANECHANVRSHLLRADLEIDKDRMTGLLRVVQPGDAVELRKVSP